MKKFLIRCLLIAAFLFFGVKYVSAYGFALPEGLAAFRREQTQSAAAGEARVVIGADLDEEQIRAVYGSFGLTRGTVTELRLTNAEERLYLSGSVDPSSFGTRTVSCVYMQRLPEGSGLDIRTVNCAWTPEMYAAALAAAGISDARIVVAAPFAVSGTGALAGVYKAYEDMTSRALGEADREAGAQELSLLEQLFRELGDFNMDKLLQELKQRLEPLSSLTDEQLRQEIGQLAEKYSIPLSDKQLDTLVSLCRTLSQVDAQTLRERAEKLRGMFDSAEKLGSETKGFLSGVGSIAHTVGDFFNSIGDKLG